MARFIKIALLIIRFFDRHRCAHSRARTYELPRSRPKGPRQETVGRQKYGVKDLDLMFTAMTVSAVLVALWQATLTPEEKLDPIWERYGSFAGLVFFALAAVALH